MGRASRKKRDVIGGGIPIWMVPWGFREEFICIVIILVAIFCYLQEISTVVRTLMSYFR